MMIIIILILIQFVLSTIPSPHPSSLTKPILKLSTKTHDKQIIIDALLDVANKISSSSHDLTRFQQLVNEHNRQCIENSKIVYHINTIKLGHKIFEASECRSNLNHKFQSILKPSDNIHNLILQSDSNIDLQLKMNLVDEFINYEQFKEYKFNDFQNLNYDLICLIDYQQLMQVGLKQNVLEVNMERNVQVAPNCQFNMINPNFKGYMIDYETTTNVPLNGTFFCHKGKSLTCNRAIAVSTGSRYKLPD
ncbi:unnamed protein product [Candida verbasci]|uniref:Uncharacterized protein n=1 Tax=Candida verbasci TaxID=1227364 RepID=A0A9W4TUZ2_9ASCO|nr:unnamed protein product [Candida verbasci]